MTEFVPRGFMCAGCTKKFQKCNHLNFSEMPPIKKYPDNVVEVRCLEFKRE